MFSLGGQLEQPTYLHDSWFYSTPCSTRCSLANHPCYRLHNPLRKSLIAHFHMHHIVFRINYVIHFVHSSTPPVYFWFVILLFSSSPLSQYSPLLKSFTLGFKKCLLHKFFSTYTSDTSRTVFTDYHRPYCFADFLCSSVFMLKLIFR